jgi:hypothetical protein
MMGYRLPEPAHRMVRLDAAGLPWQVTPHMWSDQEVLGCSVLLVRGTELVSVVWSRLDEETPGRTEMVVARELVEVAEAEFPHRAAVEEALRPS